MVSRFILLHLFAFSIWPQQLNLFTSASILNPSDSNAAHYETTTIFEFPRPTWIENVAVRQNGKLLCTLFDRPELYQVDPFSQPPRATLIHEFTAMNYTSLSGIAEISHDVFAVIAGCDNLTTLKTVPGSYSIWRVDFSRASFNKNHTPAVSKLVDIPYSGNGMTLLRTSPPTVLIADSTSGAIFRVDLSTGHSDIVISDSATMTAPTNSSNHLGIDGLRYHAKDGHLYYSTPERGLFCRVPISGLTGEATGPISVIATGVSGDDFAIGIGGIAYVTQNPANTVVRVRPDGAVRVIAGALNSTLVAGATSAIFGRTLFDADKLYVVTNGGLAKPVDGNIVTGGKVVRIDRLGFEQCSQLL
ncbi:uncharacterized protein N7529_000122 [Penicillium soppii]|uniref:uncharacterized protein n=1 Tax=Penicillium soppii TaxID=69789 RepID=UPI002548EAAF|nr:uncharacterized protein N7529_000122 [Penicillium soppii]KAJ5881450.1 hypothetical protein N7529_000122 [Penicillium soppii]